MRLKYVPILCSLVPIATVHLCYWLAIQAGHIDACNPYWDSCTSVSKTGRLPPEAIVFKAVMIPMFLLVGLYWTLMRDWLVSQRPDMLNKANILKWLGICSAMLLIVYSAALGYQGTLYRNLRRTGVLVGFAATLIAQLCETELLRKLFNPPRDNVSKWVLKIKFFVVSCMLLLGVCSVVLDIITDNYQDVAENAVEWNFALLMFLFYLPTAWLWKKYALAGRDPKHW